MHVKSAEFITSATAPAHYPEALMPEIAFAGRSNVGKSSLLNVLLQRKNLVRTSSTPGRTQLLNFFCVNSCISMVDLPGYGFAKVPLAVKKQWGPMVLSYLQGRPTLCAVVMLFDIRRTPRAEDLQLLDWLEEGNIMTIPVITKADKVKRSQHKESIAAIAEATGLPTAAFTLFSALKRSGAAEVWELIETAITDKGMALEAHPSDSATAKPE
ncbi:MAG: ribosome biogenesis GTP-binding protein YihA/YsxC [Desulfuromonadaceae bacterium]|jgi:GTP-binding protein|nr:ribosome biogenesis GTP-binding protein YihA/YsxC [Desulfuromonas sp.]MDY0184565.1 ribosome biogenesis GTP-binding protein YihA/YsxC [Desulfuromonadaceae bacterium]